MIEILRLFKTCAMYMTLQVRDFNIMGCKCRVILRFSYAIIKKVFKKWILDLD